MLKIGEIMRIYLDLVFLLNFSYDFLILMTVSLTLKRHSKLIRLFLGAFLGSLSLILLFLPFPKIILFFLKILVSLFMLLISFKYKDLKYTLNNILYLYMISITLGGFLYYLNNEFSYKNKGLVFYFDGLSPNYILLLIIAPIILFLYYFDHKKMLSTYNLNYEVKIVFKDNKELICEGFIDSGNKLKDPLTHKYIILIEDYLLKDYIHNKNPIYVPYKALNKTGIIPCYQIKYLIINEHKFINYLVGLSHDKFNLEGINCLLNYKLMEDICLKN